LTSKPIRRSAGGSRLSSCYWWLSSPCTAADLPAVSYRATGPHTDLPADTHSTRTNADLPADTHSIGTNADLPADTHPDADLPAVSYRVPGDRRADGDALAYPDGVNGGHA
jgi:hypothetical protein